MLIWGLVSCAVRAQRLHVGPVALFSGLGGPFRAGQGDTEPLSLPGWIVVSGLWPWARAITLSEAETPGGRGPKLRAARAARGTQVGGDALAPPERDPVGPRVHVRVSETKTDEKREEGEEDK